MTGECQLCAACFLRARKPVPWWRPHGKFPKSEGRDGLDERGRQDQEEKKGRGKRKLKTESCKVETAKFLSCCFQYLF